MGKTDSTGTYAYVCDGASPGSPVLSDGHALYTPGLSENRVGTSAYYSNDRLGNLWTIDGSSKSQLTYEDFTGFGMPVAGSSAGSPFGYGGGSGCQTDADTGVVLMGHRYYDTRIGRFISQDPAGSGDNWYAYAGNSPTNEVDPDGLMPEDGPGSSPVGSPGYSDGAASGSAGAADDFGVNGHWMEYFQYSYNTPGVTHLVYGPPTWVPNPMSSAVPVGVPSDWEQIPHGPPDNGGVGLNGESRWINPEGTEGLEHHPGQPGNHDGKDHTHPLVPKPNGGWTYTNPKRTIIVGVTGAALAVGTWEAVKWGIAILAAPETFGSSLGLAAAVP